jgi:hypothetical protein
MPDDPFDIINAANMAAFHKKPRPVAAKLIEGKFEVEAKKN